MSKEDFTPNEQQLINSLRQLPKPALRAERLEAIRQEMIQEADSLSGSPKVSPVQLAYLAIAITLLLSLILLAIWFFSGQTPIEALPTASVSPVLATATRVEITAEATETALEALLVLEGPIEAIDGTILSIYDFQIVLEPSHPILSLVDIGQVVHLEGYASSDNQIEVVSIAIVGDGEESVGLDGPIEAIDGNIITVNGIQVQIEATDPILSNLTIGDFVSIEGNFINQGGSIILIVVTIVVQDISVDPDTCWYHEGMGMGHWHCDGMGMGAMGMGN